MLARVAVVSRDLLLASTTLHRTSTSSSTSSSGSSESSAGSPKWRRCIDLGCGTGLMGPLLQPHVGCLAGVDLSAGMVDKARQRGCYQELAVGELVEHLEGCAAAGEGCVACCGCRGAGCAAGWERVDSRLGKALGTCLTCAAEDGWLVDVCWGNPSMRLPVSCSWLCRETVRGPTCGA